MVRQLIEPDIKHFFLGLISKPLIAYIIKKVATTFFDTSLCDDYFCFHEHIYIYHSGNGLYFEHHEYQVKAKVVFCSQHISFLSFLYRVRCRRFQSNTTPSLFSLHPQPIKVENCCGSRQWSRKVFSRCLNVRLHKHCITKVYLNFGRLLFSFRYLKNIR